MSRSALRALPADEWISTAELARRCGVEVTTVYKWIERAKAGRMFLPFRKLPGGRFIQIDWTELAKHFEGPAVPASGNEEQGRLSSVVVPFEKRTP